MPRKKKVTTVTEEIPDAIETQASEVFDIGEEDALARVLEGFGHDAKIKIKVSRVTPKGPSYCFSTDGEIDEDYIQAECGGGSYLCRIFIDGALKKTVPLNIEDRASLSTKPQATTAASMENIQLQMMREHNAMMLRLLEKSLGGGGNATPVGELTEAMKNVHQMTGGNSQKSEMDTFIKGFEMALKINGNNGGGTDWKSELLDVARDVLKPIAPVVAQHFLKSGAPEQQPMQQQQPQQQQQLQLTDDQIRQQLALGIAYLKPKARKGSDPGLWIDLVVENAEEYGPFIHFVLTQDFGEFVKIDAEIANEPLATWFKHFYDGLRSAFTEPDNVDGDSIGADGDKGNVVHDAQFGATGKPANTKTGA